MLPNYLLSFSKYKAYLLLFLLALFMLGTNPFKGETLAPMDLLVKYPGWQNTHHHLKLIHGERSDVLDAKLPIWISAKRDLYQGEFPIWNHQRGGKPGLTFTNSLFTPAFFTFAFISDDALGFYLSNLINVLIGLLGMFTFLRLFFNIYASMFGALVFMFSGFNTAWFYWAHVDTAIWTPWVLWAIYRYLESKEKRYLPMVTLMMLMLNLGGFPMIAVMTYMAAAIMVIVYFITNKTHLKEIGSTLLHLIGFGILSILIAIPFLYPLVELLSWMGGMQHRSTGSGFALRDFWLFIKPDYYKFPRVETTFYVGIVPLVLSLLALPIMLFKPKTIAWIALGIILVAMSIAFVWIDPNILKKIPLINSSLFTRFGYMIDVGLAIFSAYAFHELLTGVKRYQRISFILIILLFTIQLIDQKRFFNRFNAPVPSSSFYPKTETLTYLQNTLKPNQYVMADSGYLIAGTMGGYGLNDWFAHSFHSGAEKEALRRIVHRPFKTPTSAMYTFSQIDLGSPYIDLLNIKAILSTSLLDEEIKLWDNQSKAVPCPVLPTHTLDQPFTLLEPTYAEGIKLHLATYGEKNAPSDTILTLTKEHQVIEEITVAKEKIHDNMWVNFKFSKAHTLVSGTYHVTIKLKDSHTPKPLTVWSNQNIAYNPLIVDGKTSTLSLHMVLTKTRNLGEHYTLHHLEPNIALIENNHIYGEAYFISSLKDQTSIDQTNVTTKHLSNTEIEIHYQGTKPGWIIMPMRAYPGWHTIRNGKAIETKTFLGFLPAIKVEGKSKILMTYAPNYQNYLYLLSLFSIFVLLYLIRKFYKKDTPSNS